MDDWEGMVRTESGGMREGVALFRQKTRSPYKDGRYVNTESVISVLSRQVGSLSSQRRLKKRTEVSCGITNRKDMVVPYKFRVSHCVLLLQ